MMYTKLENALFKVSSKSAFYRVVAPFRSRLQDRLRKSRLNADVDGFAREIEGGDQHPEIAKAIWDLLRERAFVSDFRPDPDDDLYRVFGMDAEIVRDEVFDKLLTTLGFSVSGIDFTGFDFASMATPRDVSFFLVKVAEAQSGSGKQRMSDMAR